MRREADAGGKHCRQCHSCCFSNALLLLRLASPCTPAGMGSLVIHTVRPCGECGFMFLFALIAMRDMLVVFKTYLRALRPLPLEATKVGVVRATASLLDHCTHFTSSAFHPRAWHAAAARCRIRPLPPHHGLMDGARCARMECSGGHHGLVRHSRVRWHAVVLLLHLATMVICENDRTMEISHQY